MATQLEEQVVAFIEEQDWVTFVELQKRFEGDLEVNGQHSLQCCKNGVMWAGMSKEFCDLIDGLIQARRIFAHPTTSFTYIIDGGGLSLPIPKNPPKDGVHVGYEQPVWIPVCLRVRPYNPEERKAVERLHRQQKKEQEREIDAISDMLRGIVQRFDKWKVEQAFHRLSGNAKAQWSNRYGLKEAKGPCCAMRLLGNKCREFDSNTARRGDCECKPPGSDHASLWRYKTDPVVYVYQPYGLDGETMEELGDYCRKWGFEANIDTWPAWHYPGRVLFVEVYPKEGLYNDLLMGKLKPEHQSDKR